MENTLAKSILVTVTHHGGPEIYKCAIERVLPFGASDQNMAQSGMASYLAVDGIPFSDGEDVFERLVYLDDRGVTDKLVSAAYKALNSIKQVGQSASIKATAGDVVVTVYMVGSADYPPPYAGDPVEIWRVTNKSAFADRPLSEALEAYGRSKEPSFDRWLTQETGA